MPQLSYYLVTDKCKRLYNEDAIHTFEINNVSFFMIADGQGSDQTGQSAAKIAINEIQKWMEREFFAGYEMYLEHYMKQAFYVAHRAIEGTRSGDMDRYVGLATAFTLIAITNQNEMVVAHLGNTRASLIRNQQWSDLTNPHTIAFEEWINKKISQEDMRTHPKRAFITKGLGVFENILPDTFRMPILKDDLIILTSDGLFDVVSDQEITNIIYQVGNLEQASQKMISLCLEAGYDNASIGIIYIS